MADPINILSLCSGVGMLDLGLHAGLEHLGFTPRVLGFCERDAYAAACLLARMEDESLERAPVFCGDMRDLDAQPLRGYADIVCAGLPCQPYSCAGKQEGNSDRRSWGDGDGPIPHFLRIVSECSPAVVFAENVPAWVRGGWFRPVGEELCRMGFTLESPLFIAAEDVGASHKRERVFIMAVRAGRRFRELRESSRRNRLADGSGIELADAVRDGGRRSHGEAGSGRGVRGSGGAVGDHASARGQLLGRVDDGTGGEAGLSGFGIGRSDLDDANGGGAIQSWQPILGQRIEQPGRASQSGGRRDELFAPGPGDLDGWNRTVADGSFDFRAPAVKPGVRVLADGLSLVVDASRADQLRCAGNGCVPLQAGAAFVELFQRAVKN